MAITGLVHFNVNCSNYERSLAFYEILGFREIWRVPETNTPEVAAAVGMRPYRVRGALLALQGASPPVVVDLLEWMEPRDSSPPYPHLYHLGIARVAFATSDMDEDVARLRAAGAQLLSEPVSMPVSPGRNTRFVCFRDPDGTVLELVEDSLLL